jgi:formiminotetrahydrofolate cyclodeaminase
METKVSSVDTTKMLSTLSAGPGEDEASEKAYKAATEMLKNYRKQITQVANSNKAAFEPLTK